MPVTEKDMFNRGNAYVLDLGTGEWAPFTEDGSVMAGGDGHAGPDMFRRADCYVLDGDEWVPLEQW